MQSMTAQEKIQATAFGYIVQIIRAGALVDEWLVFRELSEAQRVYQRLCQQPVSEKSTITLLAALQQQTNEPAQADTAKEVRQ